MRKFKLIKEYPESPELGTIADYSKEHRVYICKGGRYFSGLDRYVVENHPEFWEEVIKKDYEILSLIHSHNKEEIITYENGGGSYSKKHFASYSDKDHWLECFLGHTFWGIHSIKRNSDGEVFTIGDLITGYTFRDPRTIVSFLISDSKLYSQQYKGKVLLEDMKKYREKSLFISEDGVEMYEGSELHIVYIEKQRILSQPKGWLKNWKPIEGEKAFSTRKLAEEYLIENKPSLSIQDVDNTITLTALEYAMLKKFVKDKK